MNVFNLMRIINRKLPSYIWAWISKYKNHEEQTGSGTLVFENTYGQKFSKFEVYGNTSQDGTPTPETPIPINNVTGENEIKVCNANLQSGQQLYQKMHDYRATFVSEVTVDNREAIRFYNGGYYQNFSFLNKYKENTVYTIRGIIKADTSVSTGKLMISIMYTDGTLQNIDNSESSLNNWDEIRAITFSNKTVKDVYFSFGSPGWWYLDKSSWFIGEGDTTDYIPHEEQTITFPLSEGQYMAKGDYLADDGIHHVRNKRIYQSIVDGGYNSGNNWFYWNVSEAIGYSPYNKTILCNYLEYYDSTTFSSNNSLNGISISPAGTYVLLRNTNFTTAQEYKDWIASLYQTEKPFELEYDLATETIEPYTQAQQEAWNAIKELHTYLDYTQISQTNDGLPFILKVSVN